MNLLACILIVVLHWCSYCQERLSEPHRSLCEPCFLHTVPPRTPRHYNPAILTPEHQRDEGYEDIKQTRWKL